MHRFIYPLVFFSVLLVIDGVIFGLVHTEEHRERSQLSVSDDLDACARLWSEAAVESVRARVLLPDPLHAAAGDGWAAAVGRGPEPPADVLPVGTVAEGGGPAWLRGRGQGVLVQEGGLEHIAAQHEQLEQGRGGDAGAVAPPAAQLLVDGGGVDAASALTPDGTDLWVGLVVRTTVRCSTRLEQRQRCT